MKKLKEIDYIAFYVDQLKENPDKYFEQQRMLINSQLQISHEMAKKRFGDSNFKENARKYLREIGILI